MYSIILINLEDFRESNFSSFFDEEKLSINDNFQFIMNKNGTFSKYVSTSTKFYKTYQIANKECEKLNTFYIKKGNKLKLNKRYLIGDLSSTSIKVNADKIFKVTNIRDEYNNLIDKEIDKETHLFKQKIDKLNSLKK